MKLIAFFCYLLVFSYIASKNIMKPTQRQSKIKLLSINQKLKGITFIGAFTFDNNQKGFLITPQRKHKGNEYFLSQYAKSISNTNHTYLLDYSSIQSCSVELSQSTINDKVIIVTIPKLKPITSNDKFNISHFEAELIGSKINDIFNLQKEIISQCKRRKYRILKEVDLIFQLRKAIKTDLNDKYAKKKLMNLIKEITLLKNHLSNAAKTHAELKEKERNYSMLISGYETKVKAFNDEISELNKNIEMNNDTISKYKNTIANHYNNTNIPQPLSPNQIEDIQKSIQFKEARVEELNQLLSKEYERRKETKVHIENIKVQIANITINKAKIDKIAEIEQKINDFIVEKKAIEKEIKAENENNNEMFSNLTNSENEHRDIENNIISHNKEKDAFLQEIKDNIETLDDNRNIDIDMYNKLQVMNETLNKLEITNEELNKKYNDLVKSNNRVIKQNSKAQSDLRQIKNEMKKAKVLFKKLNTKYEDKEKEIKSIIPYKSKHRLKKMKQR